MYFLKKVLDLSGEEEGDKLSNHLQTVPSCSLDSSPAESVGEKKPDTITDERKAGETMEDFLFGSPNEEESILTDEVDDGSRKAMLEAKEVVEGIKDRKKNFVVEFSSDEEMNDSEEENKVLHGTIEFHELPGELEKMDDCDIKELEIEEEEKKVEEEEIEGENEGIIDMDDEKI